MAMNLFYLALGVILLTGGGEILIRGAVTAARRLGVSPLLSGLLIVGFGTSAPELVVSVDAAMHGQPDIALGNVIGSNISNVLLILGLCAVITPLAVQPLALRRDGLCVVAASLLFVALAWGGALQRSDAILLLGALIAYLVWAYRTERSELTPSAAMHAAEAEEPGTVPGSTPVTILCILGGLALLISGSRVLLTGATGLATSMGISEAVIGLTVVAVGTSLPELSISVIAALRRHADVAVGNILGSNLFNLLGILGVSATLQPLPLPARILQFDQWILLGSALLLLLFLFTGRRVSRLEGAILVSLYALYLIIGL
ncbi:MAG: calcium/sodium antiporter [Pseudohongiellaceae bacterium]